MSQSGDSDIYDFADEPASPKPVQPVSAAPLAVPAAPPVPTLAYQAPRDASKQSTPVDVQALLPSWKLPTALIAIGGLMLYGPLLIEAPAIGTFIWISAYIAVRMGLMIGATLMLAYTVGISFGAGGSYLLRLLAIVMMAEGTIVGLIWGVPICLIIPVALVGSFGVTVYLFYKLFDIEMPENLYAGMAYWLPGMACFLIIWRMTAWLAGWLI